LERESARIVASIISTAAGSRSSASCVAATASSTPSKWPTDELARGRQLDQPDRRPGDRCQRALGAGDELGEVERAGERVEPVAAGLAPVLRVVLGDRARVPAQDVRQLAVDPALERVRLRAAGALGLAHRPERGTRAVGEHDLELLDVVDRRAVDDRVAARGVVADHAADRGPVGRRRVGAEREPVGRGGAVEVVLDDAGPDGGAAARDVDRVDRVHVARGVEHDAVPAHGLAGEARPAAAGDDRHAEARGGADGGGDVVGVARERDQQRAVAYRLASPA
jgi:hypothetical protein